MAKVKTRTPLSIETIHQTAFLVIHQDGLEKFSMRTLAARLGVDPMAIYHHIPNKEALMQGLYNIIFGELFSPTQPLPTQWQARIRELAYRFRALALKYHQLFPSLIASKYLAYNQVKAIEALLSTLLDAGLEPTSAVQVSDSVLAMVTGFAILEINELRNNALPKNTAEFESESEFKHTKELLEPLTSNTFKNSFETGLQLIMTGIEAKLVTK
jgi:AcrR family transcriptional regulator